MKTIILSKDASQSVVDYFLNRGLSVETFEGTVAYEAVSNHPDLYMFYDGDLYTEPTVPYKGIVCEAIGEHYPDNVKYNIAKVGEAIIGNFDLIGPTLIEHLLDKAYRLIHVKQGYAKCSTLVVDDHSIITSDKGIWKAARAHEIDALLIQPGFIELPGHDYGFIGGCSVRLDQAIFFSGDITKHPDYEAIKAFITKRALTIDYVEGPLMDLGSFIILESVKK